jgi:hypothetical protein
LQLFAKFLILNSFDFNVNPRLERLEVNAVYLGNDHRPQKMRECNSVSVSNATVETLPQGSISWRVKFKTHCIIQSHIEKPVPYRKKRLSEQIHRIRLPSEVPEGPKHG